MANTQLIQRENEKLSRREGKNDKNIFQAKDKHSPLSPTKCPVNSKRPANTCQ